MPSADKGTECLENPEAGLPAQLAEEAQCPLKAWRCQCVLPLWDYLQKQDEPHLWSWKPH